MDCVTLRVSVLLGVSALEPLGEADGVVLWLAVSERLADIVCDPLCVSLGDAESDAVTDRVGAPLGVCEVLGAHDCWMADSPTPRYGDSDVHVTPELLDARLAKGVAVPLTGPPATAWRLKAGKPEIRRANAEALHALNTRDESGRTMYPGDAGRGTLKNVFRARALPMGLPVVAFAENKASWSVVAAVAGADRDTARMSCVSD